MSPYFGTADWRRFVPQGEQLPPLTPVHGWVAISENERLFLWQTARLPAPYALAARVQAGAANRQIDLAVPDSVSQLSGS